MRHPARYAFTLGFLVPAVLFGGYNRCNPNKDPEPLAEASTIPSSQPETSLVIEDAGEDVEDAADADADAKKVTGVPGPNLKACCNALAQNAASAPPPMNLYMQQASAACLAAVAQGKDKTAITSIVQGALKGANMPAACR
jgi:hypothetical protein